MVRLVQDYPKGRRYNSPQLSKSEGLDCEAHLEDVATLPASKHLEKILMEWGIGAPVYGVAMRPKVAV